VVARATSVNLLCNVRVRANGGLPLQRLENYWLSLCIYCLGDMDLPYVFQ